jgi:serine-type D-Ala-D-Ala carboxypeptidase/endopeptidase (penicillin-binding protein 4)
VPLRRRVSPLRASRAGGGNHSSTIPPVRGKVGRSVGAIVALLVGGLVAGPAAASEAGAGAGEVHAPDLPGTSSPAVARAEASGTISRGQLRRRLASLARQAPGASGFYVFDVGAPDKRVLFKRKPGERRKLASNTKLFTTATALNRFGARARIATEVRRRGNLNGAGRLNGDLFLIGGGDPSLGWSGMAELARQVREAGIRRVDGRIFGDDSVFDRRRGVPYSSWGPNAYIAPLSGLAYGGSTYSQDPAKHAGQAFKSALGNAGVRVKGKVRVRATPGKVASRPALATTDSPRVSSLIRSTNHPSNNFYAEMLLKRTWAKASRKGTTRGGARAVQRFARQQGSQIKARDGSGLTSGNRASARHVVRLLASMRRHRDAKAFFRSLPRAGREGTLAGRMRGTAAAGRCRGKTGTISRVSALSGYCNAGRGDVVAFSLLMNGVGNVTSARNIQDRMVVEIARYRP